MHETEDFVTPATKRVPWNKGKLTGAKPPLKPKHVWAIRTKLQMDQQVRDLALFNLAIDSKLRGCDVVAVKVDDVAPNGYAVDQPMCASGKQDAPSGLSWRSKPDKPSTTTLEWPARNPVSFSLPAVGPGQSMTTRQYARPCRTGS